MPPLSARSVTSSLRRFEPFFGAGVRSRGATYARGGRVSIADANDTWLSAYVRGSRRYTVELELEGKQLVGQCTCPYAGSLDPCKHVWATLMVADSEGALPWLSEARTFTMTGGDELDEGAGEVLDDDDDEQDDEDQGDDAPSPLAPPVRLVAPPPRARHQPSWRALFERDAAAGPVARVVPVVRYVVNIERTRSSGHLQLDLYRPDRREGQWRTASVQRPFEIYAAGDAPLLAMLEACSSGSYHYGPASSFELRDAGVAPVIERLCTAGVLRVGDVAAPAAAWDPRPYVAAIIVEAPEVPGCGYRLVPVLEREGERVDADEPRLVLGDKLVLWSDRVAPLSGGSACRWVVEHRLGHRITVPPAEIDELVELTCSRSDAPLLRLPPEIVLPEETVEATPYVRFVTPQASCSRTAWSFEPSGVAAEAGFDYRGLRARLDRPGRAMLDRERRVVVVRNAAREAQAIEKLADVGVKVDRVSGYASGRRAEPLGYRVAAGRLETAASDLVAAGWRVEVDGRPRRTAKELGVDVRTGIDWLDVRVKATFDGVDAPLPELLAAVRSKRSTVTLADGSVGYLPPAWTERLARWSSLAQAQPGDDADPGALRFSTVQAALVSALLEREDNATVDAAFEKLRSKLDSFSGVTPLDAPKSFEGLLRDYQRYAQGWFVALRDLGLGGCLADDMGLGKTVQVLSMLERRRKQRPAPGPSLVVAPRSVVTNWAAEAARFVPGMRVLEHTDSARLPPGDHLRHYDLVLCTYGILRKDAAALCRFEFDYAILDEAQAIKTAGSESAKSARLLRARHRLALTGTPVENHLGELGSLLDFLNPGVLGVSGLAALGARGSRRVDDATLQVVARSVRPFLLRRTKSQVARELPDRIEQTIACELPASQRRLYDELHAHYRASIGKRVREHGVAKSTVFILEALLRLRQAACHPGLVDPARRVDSSAKLDALLERLEALKESGQKALVFSQFTSLLSIVRDRLGERGIVHEYLDGQTRDRASRVQRFQSDASCGVFLISLKAGGLGLNLTAAEYVFLLDPWWNPAVEAQAIDRAHRIGQTRQVVAYRLLARNTVEDKVALLQARKRELAQALLGGSDGALGGLTREDLALLLD